MLHVAELRELLSPIVPHPPVMMIQTADPFSHRRLLGLTSLANTAYCHRNGFGYSAFIGIKAGVSPIHAMYNRLFQIGELLESGYRGWIAHLDADAFVADQNFDLLRFLADHRRYFLIGEGANKNPPWWGINDGVFLLNLGDIDGQIIVAAWLKRLRTDVSAEFFANPEPVWSSEPDDQELLWRCLRDRPHLADKCLPIQTGLMNYPHGTFIKQILRTVGDLETRARTIETLVKQALAA